MLHECAKLFSQFKNPSVNSGILANHINISLPRSFAKSLYLVIVRHFFEKLRCVGLLTLSKKLLKKWRSYLNGDYSGTPCSPSNKRKNYHFFYLLNSIHFVVMVVTCYCHQLCWQIWQGVLLEHSIFHAALLLLYNTRDVAPLFQLATFCDVLEYPTYLENGELILSSRNVLSNDIYPHISTCIYLLKFLSKNILLLGSFFPRPTLFFNLEAVLT